MNTKQILIALSILFFSQSTFSQSKINVDSIQKKIDQYDAEGNDSLHNLALVQLADYYATNNFRKALDCCKQGRELCEKKNMYVAQQNWIGLQGRLYVESGAYSLALENYQKGIKLCYQHNLNPFWWNISIGNIYFKFENYTKATEYYNKALKDFNSSNTDKVESIKGTAVALNNLGMIFQKNNNYTDALNNFRNAYHILYEIDATFQLSYTSYLIGTLFSQQKMYDSAFFYFDKSIFYVEKANKFDFLTEILLAKANVHIEKENLAKALESCEIAENSAINTNRIKDLASIYYTFSKIHDNSAQPTLAYEYVLKAKKYADSLNINLIKKDILEQLIELSKKQHNTEAALNYMSELKKLDEQMDEQEIEKQHKNFEIELREKEVNQLNADIEKLKQRSKIQLWILVFVGVIFIILLWFAWMMREKNRIVKQANFALSASEKKFRILFEQAAVGVAQIDSQTGRFIKVNKKYTEIIGFSAEEIIAMDFQTISYKPDLDEDLQNMERLKKGEIREFSMENRLFHKNGSIVWIRLSVSAMWEVGQKTDFHIAVVQDITHQKESEVELRKLSVAVEHSPVTIAITNIKGEIEYVNPAFSNITGYTPEEAYGQNPRMLNSGKTPPEVFLDMWKTINSGKTWNGEFINKKKNGDIYYEEAIISPIFDEQNTIINFIAIKNDITTKKLQEQQIKETNLQLKELNATKDKFFSIIAHDLKNPFNSIMGFSDLLSKNAHKYDTEKILYFVKIIQGAAQNTFKLLENLLEWSRSQTGKIGYNPENIQLQNVIDEIIGITSSNSHAKNIHISSHIPVGLKIFADKNMLNTILRNLVTNAIKYTQQNGNIHIEAVPIENYVQISVEDSGVGISNEMIGRLFKINERVSTSGTADEQGTGLGLILCKEFVEKHKGKIWAESQVGKGSIFKFTLPLT